ncbi:Lar family restriction alleviation protein [Paraburkholderia bengalensis]|uniref:Lar family restriction alleviation protein n=1 Tax=Paraburkholderia bengalensis TaxID=2747562 RepID=UPI003AF450F3
MKGCVVFKLLTEFASKPEVADGTSRPCPVCSTAARHAVSADGERHQFDCEKCGLETAMYASREDALQAWNTLV